MFVSWKKSPSNSIALVFSHEPSSSYRPRRSDSSSLTLACLLACLRTPGTDPVFHSTGIRTFKFLVDVSHVADFFFFFLEREETIELPKSERSIGSLDEGLIESFSRNTCQELSSNFPSRSATGKEGLEIRVSGNRLLELSLNISSCSGGELEKFFYNRNCWVINLFSNEKLIVSRLILFSNWSWINC